MYISLEKITLQTWPISNTVLEMGKVLVLELISLVFVMIYMFNLLKQCLVLKSFNISKIDFTGIFS